MYNVEDKLVGLAKATGSRTDEACAADAHLYSDTAHTSGTVDAPSPAPTNADAVIVSTPAPTALTPAPMDAPDPTPAPTDSRSTPAPMVLTPSPTEPTSSEALIPKSDESNMEGATSGANDENDRDEEQRASMFTIASVASLGTLLVIGACAGVVLLVRRRNTRHLHTKLGLDSNGALELPRGRGEGLRVGGGAMTVDAEDDFLQAGPGGYRSNGSGSHVYRVGNDTNETGTNNGGMSMVDDYEEDEVNVDFGSGPGAVAQGSGGLGSRLFGPGRSGFSAFDNAEESMMSKPGGQTRNA